MVFGDINLCKLKFKDKDYKYLYLRDNLLNCLASNDMRMESLGPIFRSRTYGCESELDHVY